MSWTTNTFYEMYNVATGRYVNLAGNHPGGVVENGNAVDLYSRTGSYDQQWCVENNLANGVACRRIMCRQGGAWYTLNRHSGNNSCIVWHVNEIVPEDSALEVNTIDAGKMLVRIHLVFNVSGKKLYLTAVGNALYWRPYTGGDEQLFQFLVPGTTPDPGPDPEPTENVAIYPCKTIDISQRHDTVLPDGTGHHRHNNASAGQYKDYPFDDAGPDTGRSYMYCPCDEMRIEKIYGVGNNGTNTIWLRSTSEVKMPGFSTPQYLVMMVIHPNDDTLSGLYEGQTFKRKEQMFKEGNDGNASGYHFHISCGTGNLVDSGWKQNKNGEWVLTVSGQTIRANQAFYRDASFTSIGSRYGTNGYTFQAL